MYSRQHLKETAKRNIEGKIWKLFLCTLVVALLLLVANIPFFGAIAVFVLSPAIIYGLTYIYLKVTAGEPFSPADLFFAFERGSFIWKVFGAYYLTAIYTFLWSLLFIIPGIVKAYSYSMTPMILIENPEMSVKDAIKESQKLMDYHKADLFVLQLSFIGWSLLCSVTLGIASIYVIPYYEATFINFYRFLKEEDSRYSVNTSSNTQTYNTYSSSSANEAQPYGESTNVNEAENFSDNENHNDENNDLN